MTYVAVVNGNMSLVPYKEGSVILDDPMSRSLVIVNPSNGSLEFFQQVFDSGASEIGSSWDQKTRATIASFVCPRCKTEFNPAAGIKSSVEKEPLQESQPSKDLPVARARGSRSDLPRKYFKLLESSHRHYSVDQQGRAALGPQHQYFIPESLFIPGYFHKFFKTLSLLGNGARGSVYKVVHQIGDIDLGIFALKKIPIGNDMVWFQKCIREVKALSSLTHRSANLITYNHVWLEMNTACGLLRTLDGREPDALQDIPCIFILQQYCSGGNLEDFILKDVFHKFQDLQSPQERKRRFLYKRKHPNEAFGLSTEQIASITKDIAMGLQELHDIGLIHRDLKPSNCLLLEENATSSLQKYYPTIVIGDLGECQMDGESRTATGATGTLEFTAPEVIIPGTGNQKPTNYNEYTFASDMYSLGMICYFIVFGELPFESQLEIRELKQNIMSFELKKHILVELHSKRNLNPIDNRIFDLMVQLLSKNVEERPTAAEVVAFINRLSGLNAAEEAGGDKASSNEIELVKGPVVSSEDELPEVDSSRYVDASAETSLSTPNDYSLTPSRKLLCVATNLALAAFINTSAAGKSIVCYISLVLLGISINSSLKAQRWILAVLSILSLYQQWNKAH